MKNIKKNILKIITLSLLFSLSSPIFSEKWKGETFETFLNHKPTNNATKSNQEELEFIIQELQQIQYQEAPVSVATSSSTLISKQELYTRIVLMLGDLLDFVKDNAGDETYPEALSSISEVKLKNINFSSRCIVNNLEKSQIITTLLAILASHYQVIDGFSHRHFELSTADKAGLMIGGLVAIASPIIAFFNSNRIALTAKRQPAATVLCSLGYAGALVTTGKLAYNKYTEYQAHTSVDERIKEVEAWLKENLCNLDTYLISIKKDNKDTPGHFVNSTVNKLWNLVKHSSVKILPTVPGDDATSLNLDAYNDDTITDDTSPITEQIIIYKFTTQQGLPENLTPEQKEMYVDVLQKYINRTPTLFPNLQQALDAAIGTDNKYATLIIYATTPRAASFNDVAGKAPAKS